MKNRNWKTKLRCCVKSILPVFVVDSLRRRYGVPARRTDTRPLVHTDPFKTEAHCSVNPQAIVYDSPSTYSLSNEENFVIDGDWDRLDIQFEDHPFYTSSYERFKNGRRWEDTQYYKTSVLKIGKGESVAGCTSTEQFVELCEQLDGLWATLEEERQIPTKPNPSSSYIRDDDINIAINIARNGDPLFNNGRYALTFAKLIGLRNVPVRIIARHAEWVAFKNQVMGKRIYAPLTHVDLQHLRAHTDTNRFEVIKSNLSTTSGTLLDIGANWGHYCIRFEDIGFKCTAVEKDPTNAYFMAKLRRAENKHFAIYPNDVFLFAKDHTLEFDVVLALSIFHHFIKHKGNYRRLIYLLKNLKMKEMFFMPPNADSEYVAGDYKKFDRDEFVDFILEHSCLTESKVIAENLYRKRRLFKLW